MNFSATMTSCRQHDVELLGSVERTSISCELKDSVCVHLLQDSRWIAMVEACHCGIVRCEVQGLSFGTEVLGGGHVFLGYCIIYACTVINSSPQKL